MSKKKDLSETVTTEQGPMQRAILFEITCCEHRQKGADAEMRIQRIAALSLEEAVRYIRVKHPSFEIAEIRVVGHIDVLSSSEHLG